MRRLMQGLRRHARQKSISNQGRIHLAQLLKHGAELFRSQLLAGEGILKSPAAHKIQIGHSVYFAFAKEEIISLITPQSIGVADHHRIEFAGLESLCPYQMICIVEELIEHARS